MLPFKLFPTFVIQKNFNRIDINLKIINNLPNTLKCKSIAIKFKVTQAVNRVLFKDHESNIKKDALGWNEIKDIYSLGKFVSN